MKLEHRGAQFLYSAKIAFKNEGEETRGERNFQNG